MDMVHTKSVTDTWTWYIQSQLLTHGHGTYKVSAIVLAPYNDTTQRRWSTGGGGGGGGGGGVGVGSEKSVPYYIHHVKI